MYSHLAMVRQCMWENRSTSVKPNKNKSQSLIVYQTLFLRNKTKQQDIIVVGVCLCHRFFPKTFCWCSWFFFAVVAFSFGSFVFCFFFHISLYLFLYILSWAQQNVSPVLCFYHFINVVHVLFFLSVLWHLCRLSWCSTPATTISLVFFFTLSSRQILWTSFYVHIMYDSAHSQAHKTFVKNV